MSIKEIKKSKEAKNYAIIGLGATGFSCADFLLQRNKQVVVMDTRKNPPELQRLQKKYPQVKLHLGKLDEDSLLAADCIVLSPGFNKEHPLCLKAKQHSIPIIGDIELFAENIGQHQQVPLVAVTGTNGKSTVVVLLGEMAAAAGVKANVAGNIGLPLLTVLDKPPAQLNILELSSFQLETTTTLKPLAATILNVSADHLDRYPNFNAYQQAKQRVYHGSQIAVYNADDKKTYPEFGAEKTISFSLEKPEEGQFGIINWQGANYLAYGQQRLLAVAELKLIGKQNWQNALAALALAEAAGLPQRTSLQALREFAGLPHRCQLVRSIAGVDWYNDSKGTNVGASCAAIEGVAASKSGGIILIAGGQGKNQDFQPLAKPVNKYIEHVLLFGEDADLLVDALQDCAALHRVKNLPEAVQRAQKFAHPGDVVLFSPACASFDMFANFVERGNIFTQIVQDLNC